MAKLSAHGVEIARLDTTKTVPDHEYRVIYSFRSDGHILRRLSSTDVGHAFNDGWKPYKRLKEPRRDAAERMITVAKRFALDAETRSETTTVNDFIIH